LQAHVRAMEVLQHHADGDPAQTQARLKELHALRDGFLAKLWQLC
jgi:hypothetical protein